MERKLAVLNQIIALGFSVILMWILIPEHKRKRAMLTAIERTRRYVLRLAALNGQRGMDLELDGDLSGAERHYQNAYKLMTARHQQLVEWYKKLS